MAISGSYLKECARNPEKAKELEENLSFFKEGYESGLKSAQANARAIGARVVDHTESWSIDSTGNITMMASTTVTSDSGVKGWKELAEEREEKLKEKKEQERTEEKRKEQKEQEQAAIEEQLSALGSEEAAAAAAANGVAVDPETGAPLTGADIMEINTEKSMELRKTVRQFAQNNPEIAAQMVKAWLKGDDNG